MHQLLQSLDQLSRAYGLGRRTSIAKTLSGGHTHRVYRWQTETGSYIGKALNLKTVVGGIEALVTREAVASHWQQQALPVLPALKCDEQPYHQLGQTFWQVFPYIHPHHQPPAPERNAMVGTLLARMHNLSDTLSLSAGASLAAETAWNEKPLSWLTSPELAQTQTVKFWQQHAQLLAPLLEDSSPANSNQVISHGDFRPENVLWSADQQPILIDFERVGWHHPAVELWGAVLNWNQPQPSAWSPAAAQALVRAYQEAAQHPVSLEAHHLNQLLHYWMAWVCQTMTRCVTEESVSRQDLDKSCSQSLAFIGTILGDQLDFNILQT